MPPPASGAEATAEIAVPGVVPRGTPPLPPGWTRRCRVLDAHALGKLGVPLKPALWEVNFR